MYREMNSQWTTFFAKTAAEKNPGVTEQQHIPIAKSPIDSYRRRIPAIKYHLWNATYEDREDIKQNGGFSERGASNEWRFCVYDTRPNHKYLIEKYGGYKLGPAGQK
jgi:hypothetical protein